MERRMRNQKRYNFDSIDYNNNSFISISAEYR